MDETGVVKARHVAPHVVEDSVGDLVAVELVERGPGRGHGDLEGVVVGSRGAHRHQLRDGHAGTLRQQQQQRPVLDLRKPRGGGRRSAPLVPEAADQLAGRLVPRRVAADHDDGDVFARLGHGVEEALGRLVLDHPLEIGDGDADLGERSSDVARCGAPLGRPEREVGQGGRPPAEQGAGDHRTGK